MGSCWLQISAGDWFLNASALSGVAVLFYIEQRPGNLQAEDWTEQRLNHLARILKWRKGQRSSNFLYRAWPAFFLGTKGWICHSP